MLTLNIFGTLFWCLHCWLRTSEYWMEPFWKFPKTRIPKKIGKVKCLTIQKAFTNTQVFQRRPLENLSLKQTLIRIWYFLWLILLFGTQLKHVFQVSTNKSFSSSSYSCLPMKICESEVCVNILLSFWTHITRGFFGRNLILDTVAVIKIYIKFLTVKIRFSNFLIIWKKDFIIRA